MKKRKEPRRVEPEPKLKPQTVELEMFLCKKFGKPRVEELKKLFESRNLGYSPDRIIIEVSKILRS